MEDIYDLDDLLTVDDSFQVMSQQIYMQILKKWKDLKKSLMNIDNIKEEVLEFDKLLNYFIDEV